MKLFRLFLHKLSSMFLPDDLIQGKAHIFDILPIKICKECIHLWSFRRLVLGLGLRLSCKKHDPFLLLYFTDNQFIQRGISRLGAGCSDWFGTNND